MRPIESRLLNRYVTCLVILAACSASARLAPAQPRIDGIWDDRFALESHGGLSLRVHDVAMDPTTGHGYAGGNFSSNITHINRVARWTGSGWEPLGRGTNAIVDAVALAPGGGAYFGGNFTQVVQSDGSILLAQHVAHWNGGTWRNLAGGLYAEGFAVNVNAITVAPDGRVYVAGRFHGAENANGAQVPAQNVAMWNGTSWSAVGGGLNGTVTGLAVHPNSGDLIAGGAFTEAIQSDDSRLSARGIVRWNGQDWETMGTGISGTVDDLTIADDGTVFASGSGMPGLVAAFDGNVWRTLGGGLLGAYGWAVQAAGDKVIVGGNFREVENSDASRLTSTNVAVWDRSAGEWISLEPGTNNPVFTLAWDGQGVWIGGGFNVAGPFPAQFVSRWIPGAPPYPAAPVTYRLDARHLQRFGLITPQYRVMLHVLGGPNAKRYFLSDPDADGIFTVRIPQPVGSTIPYVFVVDTDTDGFNLNNSWIYELGGPSGPRSHVIGSANPVVLPVVAFDDVAVQSPLEGYDATAVRLYRPGNPPSQNVFGAPHAVAVDFDQLDRTLRLAGFRYLMDPGGAPPAGLVSIAKSMYWRFESMPVAADFSGTISFDFVPGVASPADIRVLYRANPTSPWEVMEAQVRGDGQGIVAQNVTQLSGEWALGSTSTLNILTDEPPGMVGDPRPTDGSLNAPQTPTLSWEPVLTAESYDVYLWRSAEAEPSTPTAQTTQPLYHAAGLTGSDAYRWRIVARNVNGTTQGPTWTFETGPAADLETISVDAPGATSSGQQIEVSWQVRNVGPGGTSVPAWHDEVFLSSTAELDRSSAVSLGRVRNVSALNSNETYSNRATVMVPRGIQGTHYVFVVADAAIRGGGLLVEQDEQNNVGRSGPVAIGLSPHPDLRVTSILAQENVFSGDEIDVRWTVQNVGSGPTDVASWFDSFFLSDDAELDFIFTQEDGIIRILDPALTSIEHSGALQPGDSYTSDTRIRLPDAAVGSYHLFIYTDILGTRNKQPERGSVYEFSQEFNNWSGHALQITLTPPPDLRVTDVQAPAAVQSGESIVLSWTVENAGPGATRTDAWIDVVYYSPSPAFDPVTAVALATFRHLGSLPNDASYTATESVTVPHGAGGDGYFFVHTNPKGEVFEHTFGNNNVGGTTAPVAVTRSPYPDLVILGITVSPTTSTAGEQVLVTYELTNSGTAAASPWTDDVFVSSSPQWLQEEAVRVGSIVHRNGLPAGESGSHSTSITLPADLDGTFYVYVWADARERLHEYPDTDGNVARSGASMAGSYPPVDLAIEALDVPSTASSGAPLEFEFQVSNAGQGRTLAREWTDAIYLSNDNMLNPDTDVLLGQFTRSGALAPGAAYQVRRTVSLPDGRAGDQYLIFKTDADGAIADANEANDQVAVPIRIELSPPVDLQVISLEAPTTVGAAEPVTVQWTVRNEGQAQTRGSKWFDALYLSEDTRLDRNDALLGTFERNGPLAAGESYSTSLYTSLPAYNSGRYYLLVQTDHRNDEYEHEAEFNNVASARIDLMLPPPADLTVSGVEIPAIAAPGESVSISWTLTNAGVNPARGMIREAVYVSTDAVLDASDALIGVAEREIDLAPGASARMQARADVGTSYQAGKNGEITGVLPGVVPGDYHVIVRTDVGGNIRETDEDNNTATSEGQMSATIPLLLLGQSLDRDLNPGAGLYVQVDVPEGGQDVLFEVRSLDPGAWTFLFLGHDEAPTPSRFGESAVAPYEQAQQLYLPAVQAGTYYLLVQVQNATGDPVPVRVSAFAPDFGILSVTPSIGGNRGTVTVQVLGSKFEAGGTLLIRDGAGGTHQAFETTILDRTTLKARFDLRGQDVGVRDLVYRAPDGSEAVLPLGYEVVVGDGPRPFVKTSHPETQRSFQSVEIQVTVGNDGHNNALDQLLIIRSAGFEIPRISVIGRGKWDAPVGTEQVEVESTPGLPWSMGGSPSEDALPTSYRMENGEVIVPFWFLELPAGSEMTFTIRVDHQIMSGYVMHGAEIFSFSESRFTETNRFEDLASSTGYQLLVEMAEASWNAGLQDGSLLAESAGKQAQVSNFVKDRIDAMLGVAWFQDKWSQVGARVQAAGLGAAFGALLGTAVVVGGCATIVGCPAVIAAGLPLILGYTVGFGLAGGFVYTALEAAFESPMLGPLITKIVAAFDPNEMVGPPGFGDQGWVAREVTLPYMVRFENDPALASAAAQVVEIRHPLDPSVDPRRFRLGSFGFGPFTFDPPENVSYYQTRVDVSDVLGVHVDVTAGIDVLSSEAFWILRSVDPATGTQPWNDPFAGFLPVNDDTKIGEGFASYVIAPTETAATGDVIEAQASIFFDINAPIDTPPIFNTIDATAPVSTVSVQPERSDTAAFFISWTGTDVGSGIRDYELYVSRNWQPFELYQSATPDTSLLFIGEMNSNYSFFSIATDYVGNREPMKSGGEAVTIVSTEDQEPGMPASFALHQNYPNPFNPRTTIPFDLAEAGDVQIAVYNLLGQRVLMVRQEPMTAGHYQQTLDMSRFASGVYFYEIRVRAESGLRFRDVRKFVLVK